jgi:HAD superfamily hydrolase (TIGR01509 family)
LGSNLGRPFREFSTIFFDFWDTLAYGVHSDNPRYRVDPLGWGEIWLTNASEVGVHVQPDDLLEAMKHADRIYNPRVYEFKGRMQEFWNIYNRHLLNRLGIEDGNGDLLRAVNFAFLDVKRWVRLFPEVHFVLSALKSDGYELGIVSNNTDELIDRMSSLELTKYFETITYSQEAGSEKPDPATFNLALSRTGKLPTECLHIGDSFEQDVTGARNAGIQPVLLAREGKSFNTDVTSIRNLRELLQEKPLGPFTKS